MIRHRLFLAGLGMVFILATGPGDSGNVWAQTGPDGKKCIEVKSVFEAPPEREPLAVLNEDNEIILVDHPFDEPLFDPAAPSDTPEIPVTISEDCEDLLQQIQHRMRVLETPCDDPVAIMNALLKMPDTFLQWEKEQTALWTDALKIVQDAYAPIKSLGDEYVMLVQIAAQSNLIIDPRDVARYDQARQRLLDPKAPPLTMGRGIPLGFFVHSHEQAALLESMRQDRDRLEREFMAERSRLEEAIPEIKEKLAWHDQALQGKFRDLNEIRQTLARYQRELAAMHGSGSYEHCLGGGFKTSQDYTVTFTDGRQQRGAAWALPGMNITLPEPKELRLPEDLELAIPEPLPHLRMKQDGLRQAASDRKLTESLAEAEMMAYMAEYGSLMNYVGSWMMWAGHDLWVGKHGDESLVDDASELMRRALAGMGDFATSQLLDPVADFFNTPVHLLGDVMTTKNVLDRLKKIFVDPALAGGGAAAGLVSGVFEGMGQGVADWWRMGEVLEEIEGLMEEQGRLAGQDNPQANARALALAERLHFLWGEMHKGGQGIDMIVSTVATSATLYNAVHGANVAVAGAVKKQQLLQAKLAQLTAWQKAGRITAAQLDEMTRATQASISTLTQQIDNAVAAQKLAMQKLTAELDDAARLRQAQLAGPPPPPPTGITTPDLSTRISQGSKIGEGSQGVVYNIGDDRVAKVFRDPVFFDDEMAGLTHLRNQNIPHIPAKEAGSNVIVKDLFKPNQTPLQSVMDARPNRTMTRVEQIEALEFYNRAARQGIVFGDPNSANLVKEVLPDGGFRYLATEGGSVARVDPESARKLMSSILDPSLVPEDPTFFNKGLSLLDSFTPSGHESLAHQFTQMGFSLADGNLAKHIDPDLLQTFLKDPGKWDDMVTQTRRAQQLALEKAGHLTGLEQSVQAAAGQVVDVARSADDAFMRSIEDVAAELRRVQELDPVQLQGGSIGGAGGVAVPPITPSIGPQSSLNDFRYKNREGFALAA